MSTTEKSEFYKDLENSIESMIDSDLDFECYSIVAYSKKKTFQAMYGEPMDIMKMYAHYSAGGDPLHLILLKLGVEIGMKMRESSNIDIDSSDLSDLFKNLGR
jgi:hypothetical protein